MFPGPLGTHEVGSFVRRRGTRVVVALALLLSMFVVAPPPAVAAVVSVSFQGAGSVAAESGTHDVAVVLNTDGPTTSDITVTVSDAGSGSATSGSDYTALTPVPITFPALSEDGAVLNATLTIAADTAHETDETIDLALTMTDPGVDVATLGAPTAHSVAIDDDDPVTVSFSAATSATSAESGTHTTTVELSVPGGGNVASEVIVDVNDDGTGSADTPADYALSTTSVTFAAGTADGATRNVNLTIASDDIAEGAETVDLSLALSSGPALASSTHEVTITDDDVAGVTVSPAIFNMTEGDPSEVYTVVLTSEPASNVRIAAAETTGEASVSPAFRTFNATNWDQTQEFTVLAIDDDVVDGDTTDTLLHTITLSDDSYSGVSVGSVLVNVADDDEAPVAVPDFYNVDEGGTLSTLAADGVRTNDTPVPVTGLTATLLTQPAHHVGTFSVNADGSFTYNHDGSAPATDSFTYRVTDGNGNDSAPGTVTITIDNVAPDVTAGDDPAPVLEGVPVAVNATFTDPGLGDSHTATIDWGDGTVDDCSTPACTVTFNAGTGAGTVTGSHSYGAADVYSVAVAVDDADDVGSDGFTVTVENANLTVTVATNPDAINEGGSTTLDATFDDSDNRGTHVATVDWGDGTVHSCATSACTIVDNGNGEGSVVGTHTYADDGVYTVVVTVSDGSGDTGTGGATTTVSNVAPTVQITDTGGDPLPSSSNGGEEGVLLRLRSSVGDPGDETFTYDWKVRLLGQVVASGTGNRINYRPTADGTYFVSLIVDDGGGGVADSVLITIDNAAPVITEIDFDATPTIGANVGMGVHFVDPGTSDNHVVTVSWGEGSPQSKQGTSPRSFSHTFGSAGTRNALVCVTDDDGGETCEPFYVNPGVTFSIDSDFDGNGYEDLPIGVPGEDGFGAVSVLYATSKGLRPAADDVWRQGGGGIAETGEAGDGFGSVLAWGDFDLDGYSDLVVSAPTEDIAGKADAGLIQVIPGSATGLTATGNRVFHQGTSGVDGGNQAGDRFGTALAVGDYNGDGFADLAIGVPNEDIDGVLNTGRVEVLFGSPSGLVSARDESWDQNKPGVIGANRAAANRGQALAAGDFDRDGFWDLAIGVPGNTTGGDKNAGAVLVLGGSIPGLDASADQWWTQDTPTVVDRAQRGDRFGSVLATGDFNGDNRADLAVGIPQEGVTGKPDAGAVAVLRGSGSGLTATGNTLWSEATPGMLGDVKGSDRFGFALATGDFDADGRDDLAVGIPYQELGARKNAGDVAVIYGGSGGLNASGNQRWNEAVPGVKGAPGKYDHLGWALRAFDERADSDADLVIGIPDQNIAGSGNAGAILVVKGRPGGITAAGDTYWHQDTLGVREEPGVGDRFGRAL